MKKIIRLSIFFISTIILTSCLQKTTWQGTYYQNGKPNSMEKSITFNSYDKCKTWALSVKSNADDLITCSKNCKVKYEDGTEVCEEVVRNWEAIPGTTTFKTYEE